MTTMTTAHPRRPRLAHLLPIAAVVGLLVSLVNLVPAQAATWVPYTEDLSSAEEAKDPDGNGGEVGLKHCYSGGGCVQDYVAVFYDNGEMLKVYDNLRDGHATKVQVSVLNRNGTSVDTDTYYVGSSESGKVFDLGTPDGSGDIPENYTVKIKVCINEVGMCTNYVTYRA
ncbi:MAG TPA: hypothetical protein VIP77_17125 [Jiangellaceae bacterium]